MARQRITIDHLLDHAASVIDADGHDGLSIGRVAEGLGVQPSALYNHVDGIDGLWHDLAVHSAEHLAAVLRDALVAKSGPEALRAVARAYRDFAAEHPGQYASTLLPPTDALDSLAEAQARIVELFVSVMQSFGLDGERAVHAARFARSAIHGFVSLEAIDAMTRPVDRTESFEQLVDLTLAAVSP